MRPCQALPVLAALLLCSCQRSPAGLPIALLPDPERLYAVHWGQDQESVAVGLRPLDAAQTGIDRLELRFSSRGQVRLQISLESEALRAFTVAARAPDSPPRFEGMHYFLSRSLMLDQLSITAHAPARQGQLQVPIVRYHQRNGFRLPLRGCWFVSSGHEQGLEHRRWYNRAHFAWDFVRLASADGFDKGPRGLGDYPAFGAEVLAPAAGRVLLADDRHPDLPPGQAGAAAETNFILLDHGGGEHAKLAHLKQSSLRVKPGQEVLQGQVLAQVGNSGRSDAPHLHLHFQQTLFDEAQRVSAELPLPVQLDAYLSTSQQGVRRAVARGRPRRGEIICSEN